MPILFFIIFVIVLIIAIKSFNSYEAKVDEVKDYFRKKTHSFSRMAEDYFEVKTNGKKISTWNRDHTIDFIINANARELIDELKKFNELKIWWIDEFPAVENEVYKKAYSIANGMFIFGEKFVSRIRREISELKNLYDPDKLSFKLRTYTCYEEGELHYDPSSRMQTTRGSRYKNITFSTAITPDELYDRIQFLSRYDFSITTYQYNCENQRALMTTELKRKVIQRDNSVCQICGKKCLPNEIEIDHIKPISKGGKTYFDNLQVLCVRCNRKKSNKWLEFLNDKEYNREEETRIKICKESEDEKNLLGIPRQNNKKNNFEIKYNTSNINTNVKDTGLINNVKWVTIDSSEIKLSYYDSAEKFLYIRYLYFIYKYIDVEKNIYISFLSAPSKEVFVKEELNNYKYEKINI